MGDLTPFVSQVTKAVAEFTPQVIGVAGVGVGLALVFWGVPKLISVFKRTAK